MIYPKIPDEIYENRCKYCFYFCKEGENRSYDSKENFSYSIKTPCKIFGVAKYGFQKRIPNGTPFGDVEYIAYSDGECRSFTPRRSYPGICQSCIYHNCFMEGYCTTEKADDYRLAFLANSHGSEDYASNFYTCSKWKISDSAKDCFMDDIVCDRVPPILDVKTFKLIDSHKISETAKAWAEIREQRIEEIEREKPKVEERQSIQQLSFEDVVGIKDQKCVRF